MTSLPPKSLRRFQLFNVAFRGKVKISVSEEIRYRQEQEYDEDCSILIGMAFAARIFA
jgi:hypothetical protein